MIGMNISSCNALLLLPYFENNWFITFKKKIYFLQTKSSFLKVLIDRGGTKQLKNIFTNAVKIDI